MNKFQSVNFRDIDDFLDYLPDDELQTVEILRLLIADSLPQCTERLAYNVPYYYLRKRVCFIWPSAVPWGKVARSGVMLGFCQGHLLPDPEQLLEAENRKQIRSLTFQHAREIDEEMVRFFLYEAAEIDAKS